MRCLRMHTSTTVSGNASEKGPLKKDTSGSEATVKHCMQVEQDTSSLLLHLSCSIAW